MLLEHLGKGLQKFQHCPCCAERFNENDNIAALGLLAVSSLLQRPWFFRLWVVYVLVQ